MRVCASDILSGQISPKGLRSLFFFFFLTAGKTPKSFRNDGGMMEGMTDGEKEKEKKE